VWVIHYWGEGEEKKKSEKAKFLHGFMSTHAAYNLQDPGEIYGKRKRLTRSNYGSLDRHPS